MWIPSLARGIPVPLTYGRLSPISSGWRAHSTTSTNSALAAWNRYRVEARGQTWRAMIKE